MCTLYRMAPPSLWSLSKDFGNSVISYFDLHPPNAPAQEQNCSTTAPVIKSAVCKALILASQSTIFSGTLDPSVRPHSVIIYNIYIYISIIW